MVSDRFKCIFIEVPKTASTSVRAILGSPPRPHLNVWQVSQEVDRDRFDSYFKFGFVRNPWDRAVSLYERREGLQLRNRMTFDEFIDWMKLASSTCMHPVPHRYQLDWFVNPHGEVIMDYIGRYENIEQDWVRIANRLGIRVALPRVNVNTEKKRHYTEYYNERTRALIASRFALDIEYFGYEFGA